MNRLCRGRRMRRAFMIFCGLGKGCGLSRVLHDRRRRRLRLPFRRGGGGAVSPSFFGPAERRGRSSDFSVADGEGRPSPASCRSATSLVAASRGAAASAKCAACRRRSGRRAERSARCARAFRRAPAGVQPFSAQCVSAVQRGGGATARRPVPLTGRTLAFTPERNEVFRRPHGYFFLVSRSGAVPCPA